MPPLRNTPAQYGLVSQFFHWAIVVLVLFQFTWAWRIDQADGFRAQLELTTQHKTVGMLVLGLVVLRLLWRVFNRPPPLPGNMKGWEQKLAGFTHWLLYGLILAMPVSGWLYTSAAGYADQWWGPVNFPALIEPSDSLQDLFGAVHGWLALTLGLVALVHLLAALRHHFLLGDDVLKRMLPIWKRNSQ